MGINRIALKPKHRGKDTQGLPAFSKHIRYSLYKHTTKFSILHEKHNIKIRRTGARLNESRGELHPAADLGVRHAHA
jgi:hypothetical protein